MRLTSFVVISLMALCLLAACGPKDKRVAFVSDRGGDMMAYTMASDGTEVTGVPSGGDESMRPSWSPTRDHVALISIDGDTSRLHILARQEEEWVSCSVDDEQVLDYSWGPKGERIAFLAGTSKNADVFIADTKCLNVEPLTYDSGSMVLGNWSEDGHWVVYSIHSEDDRGIFLRNPSGVDRRRINDKAAMQLAFAPKGGGFAFMTQDDEQTRIWASENPDLPPVSITNQAATDSTFAWSPDGKRIAFVSDRDGDPEIYTIKPNGSDQRQLTRNEINDSLPSWSSNGKRIIFVSDLHDNTEIFTMKDDGTDQQRLTNNDYNDTQPSW